MGVKESLIRALGGTLEQKQLPSVNTGGSNGSLVYQAVGTGHNRKNTYKDFAEEGYSSNAVAFRCINEISQGAASIPFNIKFKDQALEDHPALALLNRPNPLQAAVEYFQALYKKYEILKKFDLKEVMTKNYVRQFFLKVAKE